MRLTLFATALASTLACLVPAVAQTAAAPAAAAPSRPAITGIAFVRFYAADPAASDSFYRMLGLAAEQPTTPDAGQLHRYDVNGSQWVETVPLPQPAPPSRQAMVAFTTTNAAQLERYLRAHGTMVVQPLAHGQFSVLDPEGNHVAFVQAGSHQAVSPKRTGTASSHRMIHTGYVVHDASAEDRFYRTLLGFRPYWHGGMTDDRLQFVSLQVPDGTDWLEYMLDDQPAQKPASASTQSADDRLRQFGVMDHISLGVEHMQSAEDALAGNQCALTAQADNCRKTQMGRDGKVQLNVFDPDGSRIEFMEFAPSGPICCSAFTGPHPSANDPVKP